MLHQFRSFIILEIVSQKSSVIFFLINLPNSRLDFALHKMKPSPPNKNRAPRTDPTIINASFHGGKASIDSFTKTVN